MTLFYKIGESSIISIYLAKRFPKNHNNNEYGESRPIKAEKRNYVIEVLL